MTERTKQMDEKQKTDDPNDITAVTYFFCQETEEKAKQPWFLTKAGKWKRGGPLLVDLNKARLDRAIKLAGLSAGVRK
jgi:hypothetical protein